jgi:hypothetical protein
LLAGIADFLAVRLQTAKNREYVVLAVLVEKLLAITDHVRVARGPLLIGTLTKLVLYGRRLGRQLRQRGRSYGQHKSNRQDANAKHPWLSPGHPARDYDWKTISHFLRSVSARASACGGFSTSEANLLHSANGSKIMH